MSEFRNRAAVVSGGALLALAALAGCGRPSAETLDSVPLVERFEYDYTGVGLSGSEGRGEYCLSGSAYDTEIIRGSSAAATIEADGTLAVTPAVGGGAVLRLVKKGSDQPLQPADESSERTLAAYGCDTNPYPTEEE